MGRLIVFGSDPATKHHDGYNRWLDCGQRRLSGHPKHSTANESDVRIEPTTAVGRQAHPRMCSVPQTALKRTLHGPSKKDG